MNESVLYGVLGVVVLAALGLFAYAALRGSAAMRAHGAQRKERRRADRADRTALPAGAPPAETAAPADGVGR